MPLSHNISVCISVYILSFGSFAIILRPVHVYARSVNSNRHEYSVEGQQKKVNITLNILYEMC